MATTIDSTISDSVLPWRPNTNPLMLAPMQGLSNRELRNLFINWVRPDVVFSEFFRVAGGKRKTLRPAQLQDVAPHEGGVPLIAQLIGHQPELLAEAARAPRMWASNTSISIWAVPLAAPPAAPSVANC